MDNTSKKRIISRLVITALVLASLLAAAFTVIGIELKRLEVASNRRTVSAALNERVSQLSKVADDNAFWDEAALSIYKKPDMPFLESAWGAPTGYGTVYEEIAVIDEKWVLSFAFAKGKRADQTSVNLQSSEVSALVALARSKGKAAGGIVRTDSGLHIVSVALILPTSSALNIIVPKTGPSVLILTKPVNDDDLAAIGEQVQLDGLSLSQATTENGLPIVSPTGANLGAISWLPTGTTSQIIKTALPWPLAMFFLSLALIAWMALSSEAKINKSHGESRTDPLTGLDNLRSLEDQVAEHRKDGLSLIVCRIEGDDQNLVRLATRKAYFLQSGQSRNPTYRAWLDQGAIAFAWPGDSEPDLLFNNAKNHAKLLLESFAELPGAAALSFGLGIARPASQDEPLLALALRGANAAGVALSMASGSVRLASAPTNQGLYESEDQAIETGDLKTLPLDRIRFSPIINPVTRKIISLEPVFQERLAANARPWLDRDQQLAALTEAQRRLVSFALAEASVWESVNLAIRISANVVCHPRFPEWLRSEAEAASFPLSRLEIIIVANSSREGARANPTISILATLGIRTGMELWDASMSSLAAISETRGSFVSVRMGSMAEREVAALVAAASAYAVPVQFSDVASLDEQEHASRTGAQRVEGRFYLASVEPSQVTRLIDSQNYPEKKPRLRLAS